MNANQTLTIVTNLRDSNGKLVETIVRKNVALDVVTVIQELWQTSYEAQLTIRKSTPRKSVSVDKSPEATHGRFSPDEAVQV